MSNMVLSYKEIKEWKDERIASSLTDAYQLNKYHDQAMCKVVQYAMERVGTGGPPCPYAWFITGSGGRCEQGPISDQDHGLVYLKTNKDCEYYFIELGREISYGLNIVGYPYCQGNVMSSNPLWCKSIEEWKKQIFFWMEEATWETIRNLQIFYDARTLLGNDLFIHELKEIIYWYQNKNPALLNRLMENIKHIKTGIGPLGQFVLEEHGTHEGSINLKYTAFLPFVNAVRLLAIKEGIFETSTVDRINRLVRINGYNRALRESKKHFMVLLKYRNSIYEANSYEDTHYMYVNDLTKFEKKEVKQILKEGKNLHQYVSKLISR